MDRGVFLARLWALFGPPVPRDGGFTYFIRDRVTGLDFTAYAGPSGPCYGGDMRQQRLLRPVIEAFERLLEATTPVDCAITYELDGARRVTGCTAGRSFDVPERRNRSEIRDERRRAGV